MSVLDEAGMEASADTLGELLLRQLHRASVGWKHYPLLTWQTAASQGLDVTKVSFCLHND